MSDLLNSMKEEMKNPNVPILGKKLEVEPLFQLGVYPMNHEVPFDCVLAIKTQDNQFNDELVLPAYARHFLFQPGPDVTPEEWFGQSVENQREVQLYWVYRAMGCLCAMAKVLDPTFKLKNPDVRGKVKSLTPVGKPLSPEQEAAYQNEMAKAKAQFLKENPNFDPDVLSRRDEGSLLAQAKKKIEERHYRADGTEFPEQGGAFEPEGGFKPRDPRVLNPYIEVVSPNIGGVE